MTQDPPTYAELVAELVRLNEVIVVANANLRWALDRIKADNNVTEEDMKNVA